MFVASRKKNFVRANTLAYFAEALVGDEDEKDVLCD
jgi:hypothetical protein